jgi:hypothetical protein
MILDLDAIPFFLDNDPAKNQYYLLNGVFSAGSSGVMRYEAGALILEYVSSKTEYSATGFKHSRSEVQIRSIPIEAVQSVEYKRWHFRSSTGEWKHIWNPKLIITTRSLKALEGIPTADGNMLMLTLKTKTIESARAFAAQITTLLAEERLRRIESSHERGSQALPPPPSESSASAQITNTNK